MKDFKVQSIGFVGTHNHDEFKDFKKCYEIYKVVKRIKGALIDEK